MSLEMLGAEYDEGYEIGAASSLDDVRNGRGVLKRGSSGDAVKYVQQNVGVAADGSFGSQTEAAVKAFQLQHDLKTDGVVGKLTLAAIDAISGAGMPDAAAPGWVPIDWNGPVAQASPQTASKLAKAARAAAGPGAAVGACGATAQTWQSALALMVMLIVIAMLVHFVVLAARADKESK